MCHADFHDAVRPPISVARAIQAFLKDLYDPNKKAEPEKNWLKPFTNTDSEVLPQASDAAAAAAAARQDSAEDENMQIDRPASTETEPKADNPGTKNSAQIDKPADRELVEDAAGDALVAKKKAKRKERNDSRALEAYQNKNSILDKYGSWLRFAEAPNGQWWCHFCHLHPQMRHGQDHLATKKTEVKKIGYFEKHEKSKQHIKIMDAVAQEQSGAHMKRFVTVTPVSDLIYRSINTLAWAHEMKFGLSIFAPLMSIQHENGAIVSLKHSAEESVRILLHCGGTVPLPPSSLCDL